MKRWIVGISAGILISTNFPQNGWSRPNITEGEEEAFLAIYQPRHEGGLFNFDASDLENPRALQNDTSSSEEEDSCDWRENFHRNCLLVAGGVTGFFCLLILGLGYS